MGSLFLVAAAILCVCGMAWLALAMDVHWKQVRKDRASPTSVRILRYLGSFALFGSLLFCLAADRATMASLVWIMLLAASALIVAFTFTWRPRLFAVLVMWLKATNN